MKCLDCNRVFPTIAELNAHMEPVCPSVIDGKEQEEVPENDPTKYAVTFGAQYSREDVIHPVFPMLTGESYVVIHAPDWDTAHAMAMRLFRENFAFLYWWEHDGWEPFIQQVRNYDLQDKTAEVLSYLAAGDRLHVKEGSNQ